MGIFLYYVSIVFIWAFIAGGLIVWFETISAIRNEKSLVELWKENTAGLFGTPEPSPAEIRRKEEKERKRVRRHLFVWFLCIVFATVFIIYLYFYNGSLSNFLTGLAVWALVAGAVIFPYEMFSRLYHHRVDDDCSVGSLPGELPSRSLPAPVRRRLKKERERRERRRTLRHLFVWVVAVSVATAWVRIHYF